MRKRKENTFSSSAEIENEARTAGKKFRKEMKGAERLVKL
jgi:hypothetical protein